MTVVATLNTSELDLASVAAVAAAATSWLANATAAIDAQSTAVIMRESIGIVVSVPATIASDAEQLETIRADAESSACDGSEEVCTVTLSAATARRRALQRLRAAASEPFLQEGRHLTEASTAAQLTLALDRTYPAASNTTAAAAALPGLVMQGIQGGVPTASLDGAALSAVVVEMRIEQEGGAVESASLIDATFDSAGTAALSSALAASLPALSTSSISVATPVVLFPPFPPPPPPTPPSAPPSAPPVAPPSPSMPPLSPVVSAPLQEGTTAGEDLNLETVVGIAIGVALVALIMGVVMACVACKRKRLARAKSVLRMERQLSATDRLQAAEEAEPLSTGGSSSQHGASSQQERQKMSAQAARKRMLGQARPGSPGFQPMGDVGSERTKPDTGKGAEPPPAAAAYGISAEASSPSSSLVRFVGESASSSGRPAGALSFGRVLPVSSTKVERSGTTRLPPLPDAAFANLPKRSRADVFSPSARAGRATDELTPEDANEAAALAASLRPEALARGQGGTSMPSVPSRSTAAPLPRSVNQRTGRATCRTSLAMAARAEAQRRSSCFEVAPQIRRGETDTDFTQVAHAAVAQVMGSGSASWEGTQTAASMSQRASEHTFASSCRHSVFEAPPELAVRTAYPFSPNDGPSSSMSISPHHPMMLFDISPTWTVASHQHTPPT